MILKATSPDPDDRYASAAEFQEELRLALGQVTPATFALRDLGKRVATLFAADRDRLRRAIEEGAANADTAPIRWSAPPASRSRPPESGRPNAASTPRPAPVSVPPASPRQPAPASTPPHARPGIESAAARPGGRSDGPVAPEPADPRRGGPGVRDRQHADDHSGALEFPRAGASRDGCVDGRTAGEDGDTTRGRDGSTHSRHGPTRRRRVAARSACRRPRRSGAGRGDNTAADIASQGERRVECDGPQSSTPTSRGRPGPCIRFQRPDFPSRHGDASAARASTTTHRFEQSVRSVKARPGATFRARAVTNTSHRSPAPPW